MKPLGADALKFKMKSRLFYGDPAQIALKKNIPDPGYYGEPLATNATGKYNHNSEWSNSKHT